MNSPGVQDRQRERERELNGERESGSYPVALPAVCFSEGNGPSLELLCLQRSRMMEMLQVFPSNDL